MHAATKTCREKKERDPSRPLDFALILEIVQKLFAEFPSRICPRSEVSGISVRIEFHHLRTVGMLNNGGR